MERSGTTTAGGAARRDRRGPARACVRPDAPGLREHLEGVFVLFGLGDVLDAHAAGRELRVHLALAGHRVRLGELAHDLGERRGDLVEVGFEAAFLAEVAGGLVDDVDHLGLEIQFLSGIRELADEGLSLRDGFAQVDFDHVGRLAQPHRGGLQLLLAAECMAARPALLGRGGEPLHALHGRGGGRLQMLRIRAELRRDHLQRTPDLADMHAAQRRVERHVLHFVLDFLHAADAREQFLNRLARRHLHRIGLFGRALHALDEHERLRHALFQAAQRVAVALLEIEGEHEIVGPLGDLRHQVHHALDFGVEDLGRIGELGREHRPHV